MLGEERPQLFNGQAFNVESSQTREVEGSIGADGEPAAQLWEINQLDFQSIAGAQDVSVVIDLGALLAVGVARLPLALSFGRSRWMPENSLQRSQGLLGNQRLFLPSEVLPMGLTLWGGGRQRVKSWTGDRLDLGPEAVMITSDAGFQRVQGLQVCLITGA